jgi:hypothetical protein
VPSGPATTGGVPTRSVASRRPSAGSVGDPRQGQSVRKSSTRRTGSSA